MSSTVWWSKVESADSITSAEIGSGATVNGSPTYAACKFNNGMDVDANGEGFDVPASLVDFSEGAIGMWFKPSWATYPGANLSLIKSDETVSYYFQLWYDGNADLLKFMTYSGSWKTVSWTPTWSANDLVHLAVVWDASGDIDGGSDSMRLYVDGVDVGSSTTTWTSSSLGTVVYIGNTPNGSQPAYGIIDNVKIYDYAKTDWSDKDTEGESSSSIKELMGVAQASVKKTSGIAIASIKKIMGVENV